MTYLELYKQILLEELAQLYDSEQDSMTKYKLFLAREIVFQSKPTKKWINDYIEGNNK